MFEKLLASPAPHEYVHLLLHRGDDDEDLNGDPDYALRPGSKAALAGMPDLPLILTLTLTLNLNPTLTPTRHAHAHHRQPSRGGADVDGWTEGRGLGHGGTGPGAGARDQTGMPHRA